MKFFATAVLLLSSLLPAQDRHTHTNGNGHDHNGEHGHNGNGNGHHPNPPTPPSTPSRNDDCPPAAPVPEPATMVLMGTGLAGYALLRRRRAAKEAAAKELA